MRETSSGRTALLLAAAVAFFPGAPSAFAAAGDGSGPGAEGPAYSLAADAAAGYLLAADGSGPASADSAALWLLSGNFLHRLSAPGWGLVLNHALDLSGSLSAAAGSAGAGPAALAPAMTIHEAYARLDLGAEGRAQLFVGKRRLGLGLGTVFSPGDAIDPRTGFWDQKSGFRGLGLAASLGSELSLRAGLSLERNLEAYAAGSRARAAAASLAAAPSDPALLAGAAAGAAAYAAALGGAAGPADPRLLTGALSVEAQLGPVQLAAAGVYRPDAVARVSFGAGLDAGGLILQAEGAAEFLEGGAEPGSPAWFGTAGARRSWTGDRGSLILSLDYAFNGEAGALLKRTHYALPSILLSWTGRLDLSCRALVEAESPSALLSALLTLHPADDFDLELSFLAALGDAGSGTDRDATSLAAILPAPSPGSGGFTRAAGLAARVHF
ncbi:MAG: hypothetical protein JNG85_05915 [Spirochaetaceae bacterium]|nr:hypothetical protein [Spirochaetaceae bacterium]